MNNEIKETDPCTCFRDSAVNMDNHINESLGKKDERVSDYSGKFENGMLIMSGTCAGSLEVMLGYKYEYQGFKVNGEPKKNLTKGTISLQMSFCPFCGVKK